MWTTEHNAETDAPAEAVWREWADVSGWPEWNADIERIELVGPFAAGSRILMTPRGEDTVELAIAEAVEPSLFVDEADLGDLLVRTIHRAESLPGGGTRIVYRMEITGPAAGSAGAQIGAAISADFPEVLAALAARAGARLAR